MSALVKCRSVEDVRWAASSGAEAAFVVFWEDTAGELYAEAAELLRHSPALRKLQLLLGSAWDARRPAFLQELTESLAAQGRLTFLSLHQCALGAGGLSELAEALRVPSALTELVLEDDVRLGDEGAAALVAALKVNSTLTALELRNCNVGPVGAAALAEALRSNASLVQLRLDYNTVGQEGATALAEALLENRTLSTLQLTYCRVGAEGARAFGACLARNGSLVKLDLGDNGLGDRGARALASTLAELELGGNDLEEAGPALAEALRENDTLTSLHLGGNWIGREGYLAILGALETNTSLGRMTHNAGTELGTLLEAALARNRRQVVLILQVEGGRVVCYTLAGKQVFVLEDAAASDATVRDFCSEAALAAGHLLEGVRFVCGGAVLDAESQTLVWEAVSCALN